MNNKKKLIGLLAGLACVVLCVVLLLTTCSGDRNRSDADNTGKESLAAETDAPTMAEEETEEPTEETEATEETTEPTEEATEPTQPAGSSRPGGTSGFTGSTTNNSGTGDNTESDDTEEPDQEEIVVDAPGTQNVAYTEYLDQIPDTYSSVQIPAGDSIYYNIYNADGVVLTIEDVDAYVIYEGVTYGADGSGKVRVRMASADAETPASLRIGNASAEVEAYTMDFAAPLGSKLNPEVLENVETITVTLDEDYPDGYYYSWTADFDSTLVLDVKSIAPAELECDLTVTVGENIVSLADSTDGTVSIDVPKGKEAVIRVATKSEAAAAEIVINGVAKGEPGSVHNPYEVHAQDQLSSETVLIPAGSGVYYNLYDAGGMVLTIVDPDVYVVYDNVTYGADGDGTVSVRIKAGEAGVPVLLTIGNSGTADEAYMVSFAYPQGGADHAETLEKLGTVTATVSSEYDGTYYNWNADSTGILVLRVRSMTNLSDTAAEVSCDVTITNLTQGTVTTLNADGWADGSGYLTVSSLVKTGDQVQIVAAAQSSIAELVMETTVCGTAESKFIISGEQVKIPAASWLEVYASANSGGRILTIRDAADLTLYVNGDQYAADANGVITLTMPATQNEMLLVTTSTVSKVYTMEFAYPLGSFENPGQLQLGETVVNVPAGSGEGSYCIWAADNEGKLTVTMDQANAELASITLTNQSTNEIVTEMVQNADETFSVSASVGAGQTILLNVAAKDASHPAVAVTMNVAFNANAAPDTQSVTEEPTEESVEEVSPVAFSPEAQEGTEENPEKIMSLEEIQVKLEAESAGFYYSWTAAENGTLTFRLDEELKLEGLRANIILINQRTKEETELWLFENGKFTEQEAVSIHVRAGDEILILVTVAVPSDTYVERDNVVCAAAELKVCGCFEAEEAAVEPIVQVPDLQQIPEIKPGPEVIAQADAPVAEEAEPEAVSEETVPPTVDETAAAVTE